MLRIVDLHKGFGGLTVISHLDLQVMEGEMRCVIGPNGAGKTTLFNLITGRLKPDRGRIEFDQREITGLKVHEICQLGIGLKFQIPSVFKEMTVLDNLMTGGTGSVTPFRLLRGERPDALEDRVESVLADIELVDQRDICAGDLSHGQQQWLEIGIVMLNNPKLILLDEPTAGMTLAETARTADLIRNVFAGKTVIIIEHDIAFVRSLDARVTVLHRGQVLLEGSFDEIAADEGVQRIYLGEEI